MLCNFRTTIKYTLIKKLLSDWKRQYAVAVQMTTVLYIQRRKPVFFHGTTVYCTWYVLYTYSYSLYTYSIYSFMWRNSTRTVYQVLLTDTLYSIVLSVSVCQCVLMAKSGTTKRILVVPGEIYKETKFFGPWYVKSILYSELSWFNNN